MNRYLTVLIICLTLFGCKRSATIEGQDAIKVLDNDKYYCDTINADFTDVSITDVREVS